ncbi:hypothetical protein [uncultured Aliiroseovarius sp.]|uniref:hypothetical protein n=1 Tax=uncultured Aliiroseovarius sp. TaxID=1658783 RepID=UPI0025914010|nr:hypothetical protein [uncultured Aliiroseovarius sp.]
MHLALAISKKTPVICLAALLVSDVAFAGDLVPTSWRTAFDHAGQCVDQSHPNLQRAVECHEEILGICIDTQLVSYEQCFQEAVAILALLAKEYGTHAKAEQIASQYDPKKCDELGFDSEGLLQCQFTVYGTQAIFGHIASIWGELPD